MSELPEFFAPVDDLGTGNPLDCWRWLVGASSEPRLLSAMGDLIVVKPTGLLRRKAVFLLDTYAGTFERIASSWDEFKVLVSKTGGDVENWFKADLVIELRDSGLVLEQGECYSTIHPPALGGTYELDNFEKTSWRVHVGIMGQIHEQIRGLPMGTRISDVTIS